MPPSLQSPCTPPENPICFNYLACPGVGSCTRTRRGSALQLRCKWCSVRGCWDQSCSVGCLLGGITEMLVGRRGNKSGRAATPTKQKKKRSGTQTARGRKATQDPTEKEEEGQSRQSRTMCVWGGGGGLGQRGSDARMRVRKMTKSAAWCPPLPPHRRGSTAATAIHYQPAHQSPSL